MQASRRPFFLAQWQVNPTTNVIRDGDQVKQLEPKAMDVLLLLCQQAGEVLSADDIVDACWGNAEIGDNPVHKAINQLRKALNDNPSQPRFIETIRKRGYRIVAELTFPFDDARKSTPTNWLGQSPFPGLRAFNPSDSQVFFGRSEQINDLLQRLSQQVTTGRVFSLILGPSGSGKSSLVNAGLLPKLLDRHGYDGFVVVDHSVIDFADVSQQRLMLDLAAAMLDWDVEDQPVFANMSAQTLAGQVENNLEFVIHCCQKSIELYTSTNNRPFLFLFIDRLEVLLSSPQFSDHQRQHFLSIIEALANSGCVMILSACRNDFYPLLVNFPFLLVNKDKGAHFDLLPPNRSELMQMIRLPALAANLTWSQENELGLSLDEILGLDAAKYPDSLPMLQYTLQELYLQRSQDNELLSSVYLALGGIEGAIGKKAEDLLAQLPTSRQRALDYVLSLVVTLHPDGETITSRTARWSQLHNPSQISLVEALVDSRLFVSHLQNDEACFSLAHEALLRRWQRARNWIVHHKDSLAVKSRLQLLTKRWMDEANSKAYLLAEGKPLQEALSLKSNTLFVLDEHEQALIQASLQRVKTKRWFSGVTIVVLCLLTFTSVLMSIKSQEAQQKAQQKQLEAESLLGFMVGDFADKLRRVKRMDLLDGISNKALEYFSQQDEADTTTFFTFSQLGQDFNARFQHAQTLGAMGEVAYSRAKNDEAQQAFSAAKVILDKLYLQQSDNLSLLKTLGANAFWLGQLAYDQGDYTKAQPLFELYRDYSEQMNLLEPDNVDGWVELHYAYSTLGSLYVKQQNYPVANQVFTAALNLCQQALQQRPGDEGLQGDIADALAWLATTSQHLGNLDKALTLYQQGQQVLEQARLQAPTNANLTERLAYSHWQQAKIYKFRLEYTEAYGAISLAQQYLQEVLNQDPENEIWLSDLLSISLTKMLLAHLLGQADNSVDIATLSTNFASMENRSHTLIELASYLQALGQWQKSQQVVSHLAKHLAELPGEYGADQANALALTHLLAARQWHHLGRISDMQSSCAAVIKVLTPVISTSKSVEYLLPFVQAHSCLNSLDLVPEASQSLTTMGIANFAFLPNTNHKENRK
ncbi:MAG: AAA family ATPase [Paraglaciecola sp.]|nr:AAA family ATPase [Paraglaciecola sp.]NCT47598.1 AAA family ATPase [Paraglaciecola sp.]